MKKILAILMAALLMLTLAAGVWAADTDHTITITNPDAAEPHSYTAYQVFAGDYDAESGALSNVAWGSGVDAEGLAAYLRAEVPAFAGCETAPQFVSVLTTFEPGGDELRAFAAAVDAFRGTPAGSGTATAEQPAQIQVHGDGYYYVKDSTEQLTSDTYSDYILLVEGDVTVAAKDSTGVISEKKVKDINDSTQEGSDWQDSADYDVGDPVPFLIKGTVADDYDKYGSYKLIFHDRESEGLSFDHITGVFVDGAEISQGWDLVRPGEDGCSFEVRFEDLKTIEAVRAGSGITVEYVSILNEEAVIGVPGNPNEMRMEYSNNPTDESSTGLTPWDKVVVFTYEVTVDKVDENGDRLPGAEFALEKWVIDAAHPEGHWALVPGTEQAPAGENGVVRQINGKPVRTVEFDGAIFYKLRDKPNDNTAETDIYLPASVVDKLTPEMVEMGTGVPYYEIKDGVPVQVEGNFRYAVKSITREPTDGATFTWQGVDDGRYRITETVTPPGYNTMEPVEFDIIAEHEAESEDPQLISVEGDPFLPTEQNMGILNCEIINMSGGILPETGGIGTTLFYALGAILVLACGVALVVRKRAEG